MRSDSEDGGRGRVALRRSRSRSRRRRRSSSSSRRRRRRRSSDGRREKGGGSRRALDSKIELFGRIAEDLQQAMCMVSSAADEERATLDADRALFEREREAVKRYKIDDPLELNVGGRHFTTTVETIAKARGSMLSALVSGRHEVARDKGGAIFIDRNPRYFELILEYLRTDQVDQHLLDRMDQRALERELDFYGLDELRDKIFPLMWTVGRLYRRPRRSRSSSYS
eukprot:TRINITY_DN10749_c1_g1_i1.p1 TRINITY_DN10749_c1_g1~~TRINITY_DN10749_c1_g1_i1.p1  ORF type:complete len:226 (+),score=56.67 TRINITY_DN10749_c1_g1_i1:88-765(+)